MAQVVTLRRYDVAWGTAVPPVLEDEQGPAICSSCGRPVTDPTAAWFGFDQAGRLLGLYCPACLECVATAQ